MPASWNLMEPGAVHAGHAPQHRNVMEDGMLAKDDEIERDPADHHRRPSRQAGQI
jgi:hypothetical protein